MSGMEILMVASTAVSAIGAMQQADAQAQAYRAKAQADEYNATVARNNAQMARDQANAKEEQLSRQQAQQRGQMMAALAQSNTGFDGTNSALIEQNDVLQRLDKLNVRYEGQTNSNSMLAQSDLYTMSANQNRANASAAEEAGMWNAGSSLLTGATKYKYYKTTGLMAS